MAEAGGHRLALVFGPIGVLRGLRRPGRRRRAALLSGVALLCRLSIAALASLFAFGGIRERKYLIGASLSVLANILAATAYMKLMPPKYISRWTLILPTASSGSSLQLESIGHAQSIPSSPFGSSSMSPKVIYKEIFSSDLVRLEAAKSLDMSLPAFGSARIKLIDETSLMLFEISDRTSEGAQRKGSALIAAFNHQLDGLRRDEIARRAEVVEAGLTLYKENLKAVRNRILEQQRKTGVVSINQFNEASTTLELLRRKRIDAKSEYDSAYSERAAMVDRLGMSSATAALALRLCADPAFVRIATDYAEVRTLYDQERRRLGEANPTLIALERRLTSSMEQMARALPEATRREIENVPLVLNGSQQADLARAIIASEAKIAGKRHELAAIEQEIKHLTLEVRRMSVDAARLEDLKKDHLVAEAVFTSALARIDTNKTDIYASYPMVQTLSPPDLPELKSSPRLLFAIIGAGLGSILSIVAWGLLWLRSMFSLKRSKNS